MRSGNSPILDLKLPDGVSRDQRRKTLDLLRSLDEAGLDRDDNELQARISSYELAFRMQAEAPEAVDLSRESAATKRLYGIDEPRTSEFGTRCLLARRLVSAACALFNSTPAADRSPCNGTRTTTLTRITKRCPA